MVVPDPLARFRAALAAGGDAAAPDRVGLIGLDVPVELVRATGFVPVPIPFDLGDRRAAALLDETGGHPLVRALASALLADGAPRRVVISTTPTSLSTLHHLLRCLPAALPGVDVPETLLLDLQHGPLTASVAHNRAALARLVAQLCDWGGEAPADAAIVTAIDAAHADRGAAAALAVRRRERRLSGAAALDVYAARWSPGFAAAAWSLADALRDAPPLSGIPAIYSGSMTADARLYAAIEAAGVIVVGDDQDGGERAVGPVVEGDGSPMERLRRAYQHRAPSAARWSIAARVAALLGLARDRGAALVVFAPALFDHPAAWDLPHQRAALTAAGIPHVTLDPRTYERPDSATDQIAAMKAAR